MQKATKLLKDTGRYLGDLGLIASPFLFLALYAFAAHAIVPHPEKHIALAVLGCTILPGLLFNILLFVPYWIWNYYRFNKFLRNNPGAPIDYSFSCYEGSDQGGLPETHFDAGAMRFSTGAVFETRSSLIFLEYIVPRCKRLNPNLAVKEKCPTHETPFTIYKIETSPTP